MDKDTAGIGRTSVVSEHVVLEGDIGGEEHLHIFGQIRGSIRISGDILVGKTGVVEADVEADNITIEGTIRGNALAKEHLEILPTGTMIGDIAARSIDIREGSSFEGRSRMLRQSSPPQGATSAIQTPKDSAAAAPENPGEIQPQTESGSAE